MLEILNFIFQDFNHWIGTVIILAVIFEGIGRMFNINIGMKNKNKEKD